MVYWVNMFLGGVLYVVFMGMVWSFLLEPRWPKVPRWLLSAGLAAADMIPGIVRSLCGELSPLFHAMGYIQMAIIFLFLFFVVFGFGGVVFGIVYNFISFGF